MDSPPADLLALQSRNLFARATAVDLKLRFARPASPDSAGQSREAVTLAGRIGYPMVVKVVSADVPHRSDVGAVQLGIKDEAGLRAAVALIEKNVRLPARVLTRQIFDYTNIEGFFPGIDEKIILGVGWLKCL